MARIRRVLLDIITNRKSTLHDVSMPTQRSQTHILCCSSVYLFRHICSMALLYSFSKNIQTKNHENIILWLRTVIISLRGEYSIQSNCGAIFKYTKKLTVASTRAHTESYALTLVPAAISCE